MLLGSTYIPGHEINRMTHEGDVAHAREFYFSRRPGNLRRLLRNRYTWMIPFLEGKQKAVELGSGAGFIREFITNPNLILTDVEKHEWIDLKVDALATPFEDASLDVVIASHMIHHVARPKLFFDEMTRILKPGGRVVIQEINTSLMMRAALRLMNHEGWSYDVDVFDESREVNDPRDAWSANCAVPWLLFHDLKKFSEHFPQFECVKNELCEGFMLLVSGGVIAKAKTVALPGPVLDMIEGLDRLLVAAFPEVFAMGRMVVLQLKKNG